MPQTFSTRNFIFEVTRIRTNINNQARRVFNEPEPVIINENDYSQSIEYRLINRRRGYSIAGSFEVEGRIQWDNVRCEEISPDRIHLIINEMTILLDAPRRNSGWPFSSDEVLEYGRDTRDIEYMDIRNTMGQLCFSPTNATFYNYEDINIGYEYKKKQHEKYPKMKCINCKGNIDSPENIDDFLGADETKNYLKFCKSTKQKPQLFCCSCFSVAKRDVVFMNSWKSLKKQTKMLNSNTKKEKELLKKEKDLDREIKKYRKKTQTLSRRTQKR